MSENKTGFVSKEPPMSPHQDYQEINPYVVFWGLFYAALFALAVGYLCLKIGQTVDAFAPVSILAMGMGAVLKRKNAFPENVHIQAIASAGTNILGGALAYGHPYGASGAIILLHLLKALEQQDGRFGVAAIGAVGGQGISTLLERI